MVWSSLSSFIYKKKKDFNDNLLNNSHFLGLSMMTVYPSHTGQVLGNLLDLPPSDLWEFAPVIMKHFRQALDQSVPRYIQGNFFSLKLYKK